MEPGERNRNPYGSTRLRLCVYAAIFALILVFPIIEMKSGIPLGRYRSYAPYFEPLSWEEVWAQLPATLLPYLVIAVPLIALIEWSIRRRMKGAPSILFPLAVFAPIFVSLGLLAIYTDEFQLGVSGRTFYFYRSRNPIKYWVCVATILSFGIVLFLAGIGVIGR